MPTITIADVCAKQRELADMIAVPQLQHPREVTLPAVSITLADGEHYAGLVLADDGTPRHHLVLLPGDAQDVSWNDAKTWATDIGGELPTRQEQALLFANVKAQFEPAWYWSAEAHESNGSDAWFQGFDDGYQYYSHKSDEGRARAVRRLAA